MRPHSGSQALCVGRLVYWHVFKHVTFLLLPLPVLLEIVLLLLLNVRLKCTGSGLKKIAKYSSCRYTAAFWQGSNCWVCVPSANAKAPEA
jgi:hypothetical protein